MNNEQNISIDTPDADEAESDPRDEIIARLNAALEQALVELELDLAA